MPLRTADNNFGTAKWIVSGAYSDGCTHTSFASANASAVAGDTIFFRTGTYAVNDTLKAGVNYVAYNGDGVTSNVIFSGKLSYTDAGSTCISGIRLRTNGDYYLEVTGSSLCKVFLENCFHDDLDHTGINFTNSNASSFIVINGGYGDIATTGIAPWTSSSAGTINVRNINFDNSGGSTTVANNSAGSVIINYSRLLFPVSSSSTGLISGNSSAINCNAVNTTALTVGGSATPNNFAYCNVSSGSAVGVVVNTVWTPKFCEVFSTNTNAITGSGTVAMGQITFLGPTSIITASVSSNRDLLTGKIILQNVVQLLAGAGSPNGVVTAPKGSIYLRTDGSSTSTRAYINTNGSTAWTAITTAT